MHTGGSKSLEKHAIEIVKDPNRDAPVDTPATLVEIFKKVHTRKDKTPISDMAKMEMRSKAWLWKSNFPWGISNSRKDSEQVTTLKRKVVEVEEELQTSKQPFTEMRDSLNTTRDELDKMKEPTVA